MNNKNIGIRVRSTKRYSTSLGKNARDEIRKVLQEACRRVRDEARQDHWYKDWSGKLTKSIHYRTEKEGNNYVGYVYQDEKEAPYGKYQIEGTGIYGKFKKPIKLFLYKNYRGFFWRRRGYFSRAKIVRGIKPRNFIQDAYDNNYSRINLMFKRAVKRMVGKKL